MPNPLFFLDLETTLLPYEGRGDQKSCSPSLAGKGLGVRFRPLLTSASTFVLPRESTVSHSIVTNVCEGIADCVDACPVACIHPGPSKNTKGTDWFWIDFSTCIDCGICLQVCPIEGAIVPEERPDLQTTPE